MGRRKADWLAWSLQGMFGVIVGCFAGFYVIHSDIEFLQDNLALFFASCALLGAGLGSLLGDRLWLGETHYVIPIDEPEHSPFSRTVSWWLIAAGSASLTIVVLRHLGVV